MRRGVAVAVLVVAAFAGYRYYSGYGPEVQYRKFAEEMLRRHYESAAAMCDGLTAADLARLGTQERIGAGPPMFQTLFPSKFDIKSRENAPDGSVVIKATQTVLFNPVGVESAV